MPPLTERPDAVDRDPLLGIVRRRHPDVDIVVLPPQVPPATMPPPAPLDEALALDDRARAALELAAGGHPTGTVAGLWWRQGVEGAHRHVTRTSLADLDDPAEVLASVAYRLADHGWRVRRLLDPRPRVVATSGPLQLRADAFPTAVTLEVVSQPLVLDAATLRTLQARRARRAGR